MKTLHTFYFYYYYKVQTDFNLMKIDDSANMKIEQKIISGMSRSDSNLYGTISYSK